MERMILSDICDLIVDCPHSTAKDEGVGYPLIRTPNIGKGRLLLDGVHRVSETVYNVRNERAIPQVDDIILAREAPVGNAAIITQEQNVCLGQRVVLIRANKNIVDPQYLIYKLLSKDVQYRLKNCANGAVVAHLNMNDIRNLEIDLPELDIQHRIANILTNLDDKIELNNRINHNLEQQAQALYKSWFVDFDPFKEGEFVESELGMIPEGWYLGTLSEVASVVMGQSPSGTSFNEEGKGIVFYQGRTEFGNRFPSVRLFTTEPTRFAEQFSVLLSVRAPVGDINVAKERCCIGRGLASISGKFQSYVFYTVDSLRPAMDRYNGEGTVFGSINRKDLENLQIIVPTSEAEEQFNKIAEKLDAEIFDRSMENLQLIKLRDSLLPKLMSGELNINEIGC